MANALKDMTHDEFLAFSRTPEGKNVSLNTGAALGLCRSGAIPTKAPLAWLSLFWLSLISIPCIYFWSDLRFIAISIFLAWLGARRSKRAAIAATWREVKGTGKLNADQQKEVYGVLVQRDWLYLPTPDETRFG
ncbi:hypothetical protein KL86DPRO_60110 [uncultured delta proteobacterium]|uniref:Uncharacterized protein n=1 Tax=uncultured delta proteobacterium TaxID=34034 RepID=A0A212KF08_9DELT|nr:hypothetical protein KL86DPRO_60110 [uncultured delta proteobacterium]